MIPEIREYFKTVISEVDSDLRQHDEYFISDNIADSILEDSYFIKLGTLSSSREDKAIQGEMAVTIEIFKNGYNEIIDNLDQAFCNAIDIQSKAMDQTRITGAGFIKSVVGTSIEPIPVIDNDNLAKFSLEFTITVKYMNF